MDDRSGDPGYFRVTPGKQPDSRRPVVLTIFLALLAIGAVSWLAMNLDEFVEAEDAVSNRPIQDVPPTPSDTKTPAPTLWTSEVPARTATPGQVFNPNGNHYGYIVFAARESGHSHLWTYVPGDPEPIRLTTGSWDDRQPSLNPAGTVVAFSSRRNGNWDLYTLDLTTGETRRLTATMGYEGSPSWSPDGKWLAFEAYYDGNFDIWLIPVSGEGEPYQLTSDRALDLSPEWGLDGRKIIFSSNREGNFDIYLADLDQVESRFTNLTRTPDRAETNPSYEPLNNLLAYTSNYLGMDRVKVQDLSDESAAPLDIGNGTHPTWSPDGASIATVQRYAHESQIFSFNLTSGKGIPVSLLVEGDIAGMDWNWVEQSQYAFVLPPEESEPESLFEYEVDTPVPDGGRYSLIDLEGVSAPKPMLSDQVDEAFDGLRRRIAEELGWDFLANLDFAFVGINDPLPPGYSYDDWLYTGRAFSISEAIVLAGWVELVKDDVLGETYWRVYVRTRYQDGTLGEPLREYPWDFSLRIAGDPTAYDQGGTYKEEIPSGYYVDFTDIASDFGFYRQPALSTWRTYYPGSRFSEFAYTGGLTWEQAMLELYPRVAILTPTPFRTPTLTPTRTPWPTSTPWWWRALTPTATSTPTPTFSPSPTQ